MKINSKEKFNMSSNAKSYINNRHYSYIKYDNSRKLTANDIYKLVEDYNLIDSSIYTYVMPSVYYINTTVSSATIGDITYASGTYIPMDHTPISSGYMIY